jgi:hypothetical protein
MTMREIIPGLVITVTVGSLLCQTWPPLRSLPPAKKARARRDPAKGQRIERADSYLTIVRWTTNNPGGSDVHYGIVNYGTDPHDLDTDGEIAHTAEPGSSRDDVPGPPGQARSGTTYYYTVTSEESGGRSDGVKSAVQQVTIP